MALGVAVFLIGHALGVATLWIADRQTWKKRKSVLDSLEGDVVTDSNLWRKRIMVLASAMPLLIIYIWAGSVFHDDSTAGMLGALGLLFACFAVLLLPSFGFFEPSIVSFTNSGGTVSAGTRREYRFQWPGISSAGTDIWGGIWMCDKDGNVVWLNTIIGRDRILEWLIRKCPDRFYLKTNPKALAAMEHKV